MEENSENKAASTETLLSHSHSKDNSEIRKDKIKDWLKDPYNLILLGLIIFAITIRIYVFTLTINQPLWWDEGEYGLKAKSFAFGTPSNGWYGAREVVVPFIFSLIFRFGGTEVAVRFLQFLVSAITVLLVYLLTKKMFDKSIALIATAIMSVNAVHLFFTGRLLTYLWAPMFFLLTFYLFYEGYVAKKGKKYLYSCPVVAALGISTYGSLAFGILAIALFLLITERFNFLKKKEIWLMALIGFLCLLPQFIYSKIVYGVFVARWAGLQSSRPPANFSLIFDYFKLMPHLFGVVFTFIIALSLIYILLILVSSLKILSKNQSKTLNAYLLITLWAICIFGFYTYISVGWGVTYDGFVLSLLPVLAIIGAIGINLVFTIKFDKKFLTAIILLIVLVGGYYQITYADSMIKGKLTSFDSVKFAGEWIKAHSNTGDIIISASLPQIVYYSERETHPYLITQTTKDDPVARTTEDDFNKFFKETKPKYITDSIWEYVPQWVHEYPAKHNSTLIPVQVYYLDAAKTQPSMIIYQVKYS